MPIYVTRTKDGDWISWGRHSGFKDHDHRSAVYYTGEDARVLDLLLLGKQEIQQ